MTHDDAVITVPRRPWMGPSLWLPVLLVIFTCAAIVYYGYQVIAALEKAAADSAYAGARATAREITGFIDREHERLAAYTEEQAALIQKILADPEDLQTIDRLRVSVKRMFRGTIAFAVTDADGKPLFEDFDGLIGPVCEESMREAVRTRLRGEGEFELPPIHPVPNAYHFDLITPWRLDNGQAGVFFVSMSPSRIGELLAAAEQASGTRILLVNRDDPTLIEVTSAGARDRLGGEFRIDPDQLGDGHFAADLPGTHWRLLVLPDRAQLEASIRDVQVRVGASILALLALSGALLYLIRRAERRNSTLFTRSLQASVNRQRAILQSMVDGLVTIDSSGRILNVNAAITKMFGYEPGELIGNNVKVLMPEPDHSAHADYVTSYLRTGASRILGSGRKLMARRKDGTEFPVLLTLGESIEDDQRIFVGILHDMSAFDDAQRQIVSQAETIERSRHELDELSQIAAKDLQVPLQRIATLGEMLGAEHASTLSGFERAQLKNLTDEARGMSELVKGIAEYTRTEDSASPRSVEIAEVLETIRRDFADRVAEQGATLTVQGAGRVLGNEKQLRQVLWNLVDNALKFRDPQRPPEVQVVVEDQDDGASQLSLVVIDNGVGIPEDERDAVFEAFRRLNPRDEYPGMGLGLSICRKIVDGLGGQISVSGEPGGGSRFRVQLPRAMS
ncbi:MAG: PAS domain S-box protein [Chromatiaceae bacterium]|nr:PAS domain S-box protein [Gammaproteobacteria bacterium]MCP5301126.1 PAS domain S-box protein [Chromatiaceae bacterium]MCP5421402.1 PAS domain S-box protein [Chromatiaceae bacterium]